MSLQSDAKNSVLKFLQQAEEEAEERFEEKESKRENLLQGFAIAWSLGIMRREVGRQVWLVWLVFQTSNETSGQTTDVF